MASTAPSSATPRAGTRAKDWTGPEAQSTSRRATCSREQGACGLRRPAGMARGGAVEAINLCRKASSSVRAAPGQACSPEQRPSMPESCSGCRARCWPSRGRRARLERRGRLLAATLAFHPREGGHTMPRSSRWARPPLRARRRRAGLADEVVHWLSAGCALRSRAWPSTPYRMGAPQRATGCAPCRGRRPRCRRHGACSCEQRPCSPPYIEGARRRSCSSWTGTRRWPSGGRPACLSARHASQQRPWPYTLERVGTTPRSMRWG